MKLLCRVFWSGDESGKGVSGWNRYRNESTEGEGMEKKLKVRGEKEFE